MSKNKLIHTYVPKAYSCPQVPVQFSHCIADRYIAIIQVNTQCYGEKVLPGDLFFVGLSTDKSITVRCDKIAF